MHLRSDEGLIVDLPKFRHFFGDRSLVIFFHKSFLYLIQLVWISRVGFGLDDLRLELLGLIEGQVDEEGEVLMEKGM